MLGHAWLWSAMLAYGRNSPHLDCYGASQVCGAVSLGNARGLQMVGTAAPYYWGMQCNGGVNVGCGWWPNIARLLDSA